MSSVRLQLVQGDITKQDVDGPDGGNDAPARTIALVPVPTAPRSSPDIETTQ
jgi:hypothetical protein